MSQPIFKLSAQPRFDRLNVLLLRCDTATPVNDRIYAQAQMGLSDEWFFARLWAFENDPLPESAFCIVFEGENGLVRITATAAGRTAFETKDGELPGALTAYSISGEDLQGEYWGVVVMLPMEIFLPALGINKLVSSTLLKGNILKENPAVSAVFLKPGLAPGSPEGFGCFELVDGNCGK